MSRHVISDTGGLPLNMECRSKKEMTYRAGKRSSSYATWSKVTAVGITLLYVMAAARAANSVNFPGHTSEIDSPDGVFTIKNVDKPVGSGNEGNHHLSFVKKGQKQGLAFKSYFRNVDILWSPDSSAFVLNDWATSSSAQPYLYRVSNPSHPIDIGSKFSSAVKDKTDKHSLDNSGHVYIFASKWISPKSLEIKATGYDGPDREFTLTYSWDLQDSFTRVKRVSKVDQSRDVKLSD
jgi:hypothetical protein